MSGSWRIAKVAGIDVYLHFTFLIFLIWVGVSEALQGGIGYALYGITRISVLFGIVVLHELGHALAARRFHIRTRDIILLPIGGVARLERMPEKPMQEFIVAIAGPAVNIALAALGYLLLLLFTPPFENVPLEHLQHSPLVQFIAINVFLALFNMLPAFPMDGGRVLRAILATRLDYVTATQTAASVGQAMAVLFAFVALFWNPFLLFIALFVWLGASEEASMVRARHVLSGIPARVAMVTDFDILTPNNTIGDAIRYLLKGFQQDFPVVDQGRVVGILKRSDLFSTYDERGPDVPVIEVVNRDFKLAHPNEMLDEVLARIPDEPGWFVPVVDDYGNLVGILTSDNLGEFMRLQNARRRLYASR
jgi:stage IV sporulation protein FB